jgi:autoinducer 2-degrading protein
MSTTTAPETAEREKCKFGADSPFILIARCHVKEECLDAYLAAAQDADSAVNATETGMLHHTFDQDPDDHLNFTWSEVYKNDAALVRVFYFPNPKTVCQYRTDYFLLQAKLFHLANAPLLKFVEQHAEMGDGFEIEVYGTLSAETKHAFSASGFKIKYFDTKFGYSRV